MENKTKPYLIGIGDFSHGVQNVWLLRYQLLKYAIRNSSKNIVVFTEDSLEHTDNIMNDLKLEIGVEYNVTEGLYPYGPLERYSYRAWDSKIYLKIIKYIRRHRDRITIIGVDSETQARDKIMADSILDKLDATKINYFWGANAHVDAREITESYELKWVPDEKYRCGYYLKEKLGDNYLIILTTARTGRVRFSSVCDNMDCDNRTFPKEPIYKDFEYDKYDRHLISAEKKYAIFERGDFKEQIVEFTDAVFPDGYFLIKSNTWDRLIIFNKVRAISSSI